MLKIKMLVSAQKVVNFCVENECYTLEPKGNYEKLLEFCASGPGYCREVSASDIEKIVKDIFEHTDKTINGNQESDIEDLYKNLMFSFLNDCVIYDMK